MSSPTTILNGVTIASQYNYGTNMTKTDLTSAGWGGVQIEADVTTGAIPPTSGKEIWIFCAFTSASLAGTVTPDQLQGQYFKVIPDINANKVKAVISAPLGVSGNYMYTWVNTPDILGQSVTLTVTAVQSAGIGGGGGVTDVLWSGSGNTIYPST